MANYDNSRYAHMAQPIFKDKNEEYDHLKRKVYEYMQTEEMPSLPTREQELAYMKNLEKSILTDKWLTIHPQKSMPSPYRLGYKNYQKFKNEYYKNFILNGAITTFILLPFIHR